MFANLRSWLPAKPSTYQRRAPLVLVNGLAEQAETWYCNVAAWRRHFEVHTPNILAYEGAALHRHIDEGGAVDVDYLVQRLHDYLDSFVQTPPYHIVANSLGGKIAVEYAVRYPEQVARIVLLCPSGLSDEERLPVVEGVRRNDLKSLVDSVFSDTRHADPVMLAYYRQKFTNRRWRSGLMRTIRGTMHHRAADSLARVTQRALVVVGDADRIVDANQTRQTAERLPNGRVIVLKNCGHAPQIERAATVNRLVIDFMREAGHGVHTGEARTAADTGGRAGVDPEVGPGDCVGLDAHPRRDEKATRSQSSALDGQQNPEGQRPGTRPEPR